MTGTAKTICALTMVHRDHWALSRWYAHHARALGPENLFIVAHGADPEVARLCPEASILTVPRRGFDNFDRDRAQLLNGIMAGLLASYDWAIRTDADELICFDPARFASLAEAIAAQDAPVLTALGFDLVEQPQDAEMAAAPVFDQRRAVGFSGHYSKAVAARRPIEFLLHGSKVAPRRLQSFPFTMPRGLYLAHLKYANRAAMPAANAVRMQVGNSAGQGLPGAGWKAAEDDTAWFLEDFAAKKHKPWEVAEAQAYETLSTKPSRSEKFSVVKTRALKFPVRSTLPERFAGQG